MDTIIPDSSQNQNDSSRSTPGTIKERNEDALIAGEAEIRGRIAAAGLAFNARFLLKAEAYLLQLAYSHNKILSLSNSRTRILAHQVECTHRVMSAVNRRFLVADEVGLGKTVEAGLIIKELEYRHNYKKMLIVCPASLLYQWQHEMLSKFNDSFVIMDRKEMRRLACAGAGEGPWDAHDKIICSLDFIKNRRLLKQLQSVSWDAVIFDEAHRLRRDARQATLAFEAALAVSERTKALLLLTATPFRGKLEELYYLIGLLDKNILGPFQSFFIDYCLDQSDLSTLREKIAPVLIRRTKQEVGGFTGRRARTIRFELYPDERELYDETTLYVAEEFNLAMKSENRAVGFVMTIFQKLLDSSSSALGSALANRMKRLEEMAQRAEIERRIQIDYPADRADLVDDAEDADELVCLSSSKTAVEIRREIQTLKRLVDLSSRITVNKKAEKLLELIKRLKKQGHPKFLIFTQFRTTQEYLRRTLSGFRIGLFHGSLSRDEKESAILRFKEDVEVLISTEAGGEGRNLQFCHVIINYDLPWSPLKIEQRIGRLHRFGQVEDVLIFNFSTKDTVAERVLEVLEKKLKLFEESIGMPDVLLGRIEDELRLDSLIMEMAAGSRTGKSVNAEVEARLERARAGYEKISELAVADRIDFNYDEYYRITLKDRKFSNRRIERFVQVLTGVDDEAARLVSRDRTAGLYRVLSDEKGGTHPGRRGTFDSGLALENEELDFLAFGHPVIDRLVERCQSRAFGGDTGVSVVAAGRPLAGMVFYYLVTFRSAFESREIMPVAAVKGRLCEDELNSVEHDLVAHDFSQDMPEIDALAKKIAGQADEYFAIARERIFKKISIRKNELARKIDLNIDPEIEKIRDSFDRKIAELQEKLEVLEAQHKWYGRNMKGVITRTRNLIARAGREREAMLRKYRGYLDIEFSVKLVCAGMLISRPV